MGSQRPSPKLTKKQQQDVLNEIAKEAANEIDRKPRHRSTGGGGRVGESEARVKQKKKMPASGRE